MTEIAKDRPPKGIIPKISLTKLKKLWQTRRTTEEIAVVLQVSLAYLHTFARLHDLPKRTHVAARRRKPYEKEVDPTPEEIIARSAEVRARWTDKEYARNSAYKHQNVEIKQYSYDSRTGIFSDCM